MPTSQQPFKTLVPLLAAACLFPAPLAQADAPGTATGANPIPFLFFSTETAQTLNLPRLSVSGLVWPSLPQNLPAKGTANSAEAAFATSSAPFPFSDLDAEQMLPLDAAPEKIIIPIAAPPADSGTISSSADRAVVSADSGAAAPAASLAAPPSSTQYGPITISNTGQLYGDLDKGIIGFRNGGRLVYTDPRDNSETTLNAESAEFDARTGLLTAHKGARLERTEGSFVAEEIAYNLTTRAGFVTNAIAESDYFRMRGDRIEALADGSYVVENGVFTTCIRGRPDYQIRAKRLTVHPNQFVSARNVTFYAGPTALITLPTLRRSLATRTSVPTPVPGYSKNEGIFAQFNDTFIQEPHRTLEFDGHFNLKRTPTGYLGYEFDVAHTAPKAPPPHTMRTVLSDPLRGTLEQLTPPTYREYTEDRYEDEFAPRTTVGVVLQNQQFVYNRRRTDLNVSRFPEISARFTNILGRASDGDMLPGEGRNADRDRNGSPRGPMGATINPLLQRISSAPFLLDVNLFAGAIDERPTRVTSGRFSTQISAATQPILVGRRLSLRFAVTDWLNAYTRGGSVYNLFSPETELDYLPTRTTRFGVGYRFADDLGRTPFAFDHQDVRHELRLLFQTGGPIAFGVESKFDLERSRAYDSEIAVLRNFDCMQVGVAYRLRSQQFNVIFNLLPPTRDRATRRNLPLQSVPGSRPSE